MSKALNIVAGETVRKYGDDDWFTEGTVLYVCPVNRTVEVDYSDWIEVYPYTGFKLIWPEDGSFEQVLVPTVEGKVTKSFKGMSTD